MKKLFVTLSLVLLGSIYVLADFSSEGCPGSGQMCCKETVSVLWGAFEYDETHYSNQSKPTNAEELQEVAE